MFGKILSTVAQLASVVGVSYIVTKAIEHVLPEEMSKTEQVLTYIGSFVIGSWIGSAVANQFEQFEPVNSKN